MGTGGGNIFSNDWYFLCAIAHSTWSPEEGGVVGSAHAAAAWAQRLASGRTLFEVLPAQPAAAHVPRGVIFAMLPGTTMCLAYMKRGADGVGWSPADGVKVVPRRGPYGAWWTPAEERGAVSHWIALVQAGPILIFIFHLPVSKPLCTRP